MTLALLAGLAMVIQDVLLTLMVQAQARNHWVLAGLLDSAGFLAQVATFGVSIEAIIKHGLVPETYLILVVLTIANFAGTGLGTKLGSKWIHAQNLGSDG